MHTKEREIKLRQYQQDSIDCLYTFLRENKTNPCIEIPTAGGKTPVMATIIKDAVGKWNGRVCVIAHVEELLEQTVDKINKMAPELFLKTGIYSAGLGKKQNDKAVTVAGIQSIFKKAHEFEPFDLILIDEAHLIPVDGEGMYRTFIEGCRKINPNVRVIGLTATPFRMRTGSICSPENILNEICYRIGVKDLIDQGYICKLVSKGGKHKVDTSNLHIRAGEFIDSEMQELMNSYDVVTSAVREILEYCRERKSCLIFTTGLEHAGHVERELSALTSDKIACIFGNTPKLERAWILKEFKEGKIKYLVNVNVLTTGFDATNIDCIALLRPTMSPGLYYQMVGRGFRIEEGKENCLVLDFGNNIIRHGPVDMIRAKENNHTRNREGEDNDAPMKQCPDCQSIIYASYPHCPDCGFEFPKKEKHEPEAAEEDIVSSGKPVVEAVKINDTRYTVHTKFGASETAPKTMKVEYFKSFLTSHSEYVCFEHGGWAREKAESWWRKRSNAPMPKNCAEAVSFGLRGFICKTEEITVSQKAGEKYDKIIGHALEDDIPAWREPGLEEDGSENLTDSLEF